MVVDPGFRLFVGDMVTGRITADLPAASCKWGIRLNSAGVVETTTRPRAAELARLDVRAATAPLKQYLAVAYEGTILEAGPIWKRKWSAAAGTLQVSGSGIWSLLDRVKLLDWAAINAGTATTRTSVDITARTLGGIAREMYRRAVTLNPGNPGLPVVLPADTAGTQERHVKGYELQWLGDLLKKLTEVQGGPDIAFRPRYTADGLAVEWVMATGTDADPLLHQAGPDWVWDGTVDGSGVTEIDVDEDATGMAARVWQPGAGSELDMRLATATDTSLITGAGYPWTEADAASKDVEDQTILQGHADAALAVARRPVETWGLSARADIAPRLGTYMPGDVAEVHVGEGHPLIGRGKRRVRIMAVDGDGTQTVKLTPAPIPGSLGSTSYGAALIEGGVRTEL